MIRSGKTDRGRPQIARLSRRNNQHGGGLKKVLPEILQLFRNDGFRRIMVGFRAALVADFPLLFRDRDDAFHFRRQIPSFRKPFFPGELFQCAHQGGNALFSAVPAIRLQHEKVQNLQVLKHGMKQTFQLDRMNH